MRGQCLKFLSYISESQSDWSILLLQVSPLREIGLRANGAAEPVRRLARSRPRGRERERPENGETRVVSRSFGIKNARDFVRWRRTPRGPGVKENGFDIDDI